MNIEHYIEDKNLVENLSNDDFYNHFYDDISQELENRKSIVYEERMKNIFGEEKYNTYSTVSFRFWLTEKQFLKKYNRPLMKITHIKKPEKLNKCKHECIFLLAKTEILGCFVAIIAAMFGIYYIIDWDFYLIWNFHSNISDFVAFFFVLLISLFFISILTAIFIDNFHSLMTHLKSKKLLKKQETLLITNMVNKVDLFF